MGQDLFIGGSALALLRSIGRQFTLRLCPFAGMFIPKTLHPKPYMFVMVYPKPYLLNPDPTESNIQKP